MTATDRTEVQVREIPDGESLTPFIDLAWKFNAADPSWIAPLRMSVKSALDRKKHPFHQHAEVAYFLAEKPGVGAVGRIAAIVNHAHNSFHNDDLGFVGLFESEDDQGTANALFDAAATWLQARGRSAMRGPMNFSTNEEVASPGVQLEGFEHRPAFMMTHNPPYYAALFERAGFEKAKDVLAFHLEDHEAMPERWGQMFDRMLARHGATLRTIDLKHFRRDVDKIKEVYNAAWSGNWGFVPMTDAEFEHLAKEFRPVVDGELCLIAEVEGEAIGFALAIPDLNEVLRHIPSGRLLPFGFLKFLWHRRKVRGMRVMTLGVRPKYHHAGVGAPLYMQLWTNGANVGYRRGEASWILEDNLEMARAMERAGGSVMKRYRIFERPLG